jgi:hypothetical protein
MRRDAAISALSHYGADATREPFDRPDWDKSHLLNPNRTALAGSPRHPWRAKPARLEENRVAAVLKQNRIEPIDYDTD